MDVADLRVGDIVVEGNAIDRRKVSAAGRDPVRDSLMVNYKTDKRLTNTCARDPLICHGPEVGCMFDNLRLAMCASNRLQLEQTFLHIVYQVH